VQAEIDPLGEMNQAKRRLAAFRAAAIAIYDSFRPDIQESSWHQSGLYPWAPQKWLQSNSVEPSPAPIPSTTPAPLPRITRAAQKKGDPSSREPAIPDTQPAPTKRRGRGKPRPSSAAVLTDDTFLPALGNLEHETKRRKKEALHTKQLREAKKLAKILEGFSKGDDEISTPSPEKAATLSTPAQNGSPPKRKRGRPPKHPRTD
jgi:hypothetical protein